MHPLLGIIVTDVRSFLTTPSVVHQDFKAPQLLSDLIDCFVDLLKLSNVTCDGYATTPHLADFLRRVGIRIGLDRQRCLDPCGFDAEIEIEPYRRDATACRALGSNDRSTAHAHLRVGRWLVW